MSALPGGTPIPDAELAKLREQLVVETTRRAVQALKAPDPLD